MTDVNRDTATTEQHGFRPLTEGYLPGAQLQRGFAPLPSATSSSPPRGGSSASKPAQASTAADAQVAPKR